MQVVICELNSSFFFAGGTTGSYDADADDFAGLIYMNRTSEFREFVRCALGMPRVLCYLLSRLLSRFPAFFPSRVSGARFCILSFVAPVRNGGKSIVFTAPKPAASDFTRAARAQAGGIMKMLAFLKATVPQYMNVHQHLTARDDEFTVGERHLNLSSIVLLSVRVSHCLFIAFANAYTGCGSRSN
jgi:hypothetical protein